MKSNLGLVLNVFGLGLVAWLNYIYPRHVTAIITIAFFFRRKFRLNVLWYLICSMVKNLLT